MVDDKVQKQMLKPMSICSAQTAAKDDHPELGPFHNRAAQYSVNDARL